MGQNSGDAQKYLKEIALNKKMEYMGYSKVVMPSNYVVSEKAISNDEAIKIINDALPITNNLTLLIKNNQKFDEPKKNILLRCILLLLTMDLINTLNLVKNLKLVIHVLNVKSVLKYVL